MPCVYVCVCYGWLSWLPELKLAINSIVFHIVCAIQKLSIDWFVITDWHVFKRMKSFTTQSKKKLRWIPSTSCLRDRESLDPFNYYLCILPSSEINSYKAPINPVEMVSPTIRSQSSQFQHWFFIRSAHRFIFNSRFVSPEENSIVCANCLRTTEWNSNINNELNTMSSPWKWWLNMEHFNNEANINMDINIISSTQHKKPHINH